MGVDANGGLFPLAFAVVEGESKDSWAWFLCCIFNYIPSAHASRTITFISDRHKGIPSALRENWHAPYHHRYCLRHIRANFQAEGHTSKTLLFHFYEMGCATDEVTFQKYRKKILKEKPAADKWITNHLEKPPPAASITHMWALYADDGARYSMMTTNCSESFNGVLKGARALPIQALIARTFYRLNLYFYKRRADGLQWRTSFTPKTEGILRTRVQEARFFSIVRYGDYEWQVLDADGNSFTVILQVNQCSCTCNIPKLQHIPCSHVIAASSNQAYGANVSYLPYCSTWYSMSKYRLAYAPMFHPVPDKRYWSEPRSKSKILPPDRRRLPGRPPSVRIRTTMDDDRVSGRQNKCSNCKQPGHYKSRCRNPPAA